MKTTSGPAAVIERLIEDDYLQEQIATGGERVLAAYRRARAMRAEDAVQDRKLYDHVRGAAGAITESAQRLLGRPEPEPPRRWRRLPVVLAGAGVIALVWTMHRVQQRAGTPAHSPTVS